MERMLSFGLARVVRFSRKNSLVLDGVGEVGFVKVEAGFPFLTFAEAEVFHELGGGVTKMDGDGFAHGFTCEV